MYPMQAVQRYETALAASADKIVSAAGAGAAVNSLSAFTLSGPSDASTTVGTVINQSSSGSNSSSNSGSSNSSSSNSNLDDSINLKSSCISSNSSGSSADILTANDVPAAFNHQNTSSDMTSAHTEDTAHIADTAEISIATIQAPLLSLPQKHSWNNTKLFVPSQINSGEASMQHVTFTDAKEPFLRIRFVLLSSPFISCPCYLLLFLPSVYHIVGIFSNLLYVVS